LASNRPQTLFMLFLTPFLTTLSAKPQAIHISLCFQPGPTRYSYFTSFRQVTSPFSSSLRPSFRLLKVYFMK
jgi:hypothetical protein